MTNRIKILDSIVVDQIAAGEVVERPASVVKELVENSLDAGSKSVQVLIKGGGIEYLSISDDGIGMDKDDLLIAVERFATSKLRNVGDLQKIASFGFRGEALPSIASVSEFSIKTRALNSEQGYLLEVNSGRKTVTEYPKDFGTTIEVRNLFYNVPARRKFLKSSITEANSIKSVIADFALARPDVSFLLQDEGRQMAAFSHTDSLEQRIRKLNLVQGTNVYLDYQKSITDQEGATYPISVSGIISEPLFCPKIGSKIRFLINGRMIRSPLLMRAVRDGYESLLKHGYYPSGVINIEIAPSHIDVNVHPQKSEIRFRNEGAVFAALKTAVNLALKEASASVIENKVYELRQFEKPRINQEEIRFIGNGSIVQEFYQNSEKLFISETVVEEPFAAFQTSEKLRFIGQIFKLYLLFSDNHKFAIVDMHAAHERVTFFRLKEEFVKSKRILAEDLLFPISLPLDFLTSLEDIDLKLRALCILGIEAELRNDEVVIRAMSKILNTEKIRDLLNAILDKSTADDFNVEISKKIDSYLARLACHGSLRRGRELKSEEAYELIDQLNRAEHSGWCPHGRPVIWWLSESDLERQFGRIQ